MAKRAGDRFPSVTAFAQAFEGAIQGKAGTSTNFFTFKVKVRPPKTFPSTGSAAKSSQPGVRARTPSGITRPPVQITRSTIVIGASGAGIVLLLMLIVLVISQVSKPGEPTVTPT